MPRAGHTAWTPLSLPNVTVLLGGNDFVGGGSSTAEILPGINEKESFHSLKGGGTFALRHDGTYACWIPDGDTIVMTGGRGPYVTRWEDFFRKKETRSLETLRA